MSKRFQLEFLFTVGGREGLTPQAPWLADLQHASKLVLQRALHRTPYTGPVPDAHERLNFWVYVGGGLRGHAAI